LSLGKRLRRLRTERGLTQKELAEPAYTHAYVSTIEAGRRQPSPAAVQHFAKQLGIEVDELLTGRPPDLEPRLRLQLQEARLVVSRGELDRAQQVFADVQREATRYSLPLLESKATEGLALCRERAGDPEGSVELYERAEELLAGESALATVDALAGKTRAIVLLGDVRYAIHLLEDRIDTLTREGLRDPDALVRLYASLVASYFMAGLYGKAGDAATEALRFAPRAGDPESIANMHMNVARVLLHEGRGDQADDSLRRAEDLYGELDLRAELAACHLAHGFVLSRNEDYDGARSELETARAQLKDAHNSIDEARAVIELARVERLSGGDERARALATEAIELIGPEGDAGGRGEAFRELGLAEFSDPPKAEKHLRAAIELFERAEKSVDLSATYRALGDLGMQQGDTDLALESYRSGILALEERL
jgi:tetratricopeptide (TPR) repeat protein